MLTALRYLLAYFARFVFWLRYRVHVEGLDEIRGLERALILPNHPAYMDPAIVLSAVWPVLRPRPMLLAEIFKNPLLFWLPRALRAVEIPNLEQQSAAARQQAQESIKAVVEGLRRGENFILWPSGRVQRRGTESLGAARSLAEILASVPEANVVAVRTRGLWGSSFSFARGEKPPLMKNLLKGIALLFANLLFFSPRRNVHLTVQRFTPKELPERTRERINPFFEAWYNAPGPEQPTYVPYHFLFGPRTYEFPVLGGAREVRTSEIAPQIRADVGQMVEEKLQRPLTEAEQKPDVVLESLGLDSLDRMELSISIEGRFGFRSEEVPNTLGELWALAAGMVERAPAKPAPPEWFAKSSGDRALSLLGDTIPDAFLRRALMNSGDVALADDLSGVLTYEKLLVGARAMASQLRAIEAPNVGLMLPASVAGDLVFLALHLAKKLPVVMNWTTGPANLAHAARTMQLTHVVTSKRFVDRTGITIEGVEFAYLEEMRRHVGKMGLLWELLRVKWEVLTRARSAKPETKSDGQGLLQSDPPHPPLGKGGPEVSPLDRGVPEDPPLYKGGRRPVAVGGVNSDANAVVLFTSGSEKAPKAVPLTHGNILSNLQSVIDSYNLSRDDSLIGFLPIFHSFGVTVTTLLPALTGIRVVHHPDPTDAGGLQRKIAEYRPTVLVATPTFVGYILDRSTAADLKSLRLIVVGAEKCPPALFDRARQLAPQAQVLEGYGITECAPMVAANRLDRNHPGTIGLPLPGITVKIVDPDSLAPLPQGQMGMMLVHGPNVFHGYIPLPGSEPPPDPFTEQDGKRWYVTGDLALIDEEGFIHFSGRLKRFIKAGGEMISLPAIEEPLAQQYPPTEDGPRVAIEGVELPGGGRRIVLFTTQSITVGDANNLLAGKGMKGIMRIDEVRRLEKIPVLGTGKTDYKVLRTQISQAS